MRPDESVSPRFTPAVSFQKNNKRVLSCLKSPHPSPVRLHPHTFAARFILSHLQTEPPRSSAHISLPVSASATDKHDVLCVYTERHTGRRRFCLTWSRKKKKKSHGCPVIRPLSFLFKPHFHLLSLLCLLAFSFFLCLSTLLLYPLTYPTSSDQPSAGV